MNAVLPKAGQAARSAAGAPRLTPWWVGGISGPLYVRVGIVLLALLVAVAGFDLAFIVTSVNGVQFRPHHILAAAAASAAIPALAPRMRAHVVLLVVACGTMLVSASVSDFGRVWSQPVLDTGVAYLVGLAVLGLVRTHAQRVMLLRALGVGAIAVVVVALTTHFGPDDAIFGDRYRGRVTRLHGADRLTRPLLHANVAAMFFGPIAAGCLSIVAFANRRLTIGVAAAVIVVTLTAMTASRAALLSVVVATGVLGIARATRAGLLAAIVIVSFVVAFLLSPAVRGRIETDERFSASIDGPGDLILDSTRTLDVLVRNDSPASWPAAGPDRVTLTARWRDTSQSNQWLTQVWPLPRPVAPGERTAVTVRVPRQVPDGTYVVVWDLLLDREAFFLESSGVQEVSSITVTGSTATAEPEPVTRARPNPTRPQIWSWAAELLVDRPALGHGPGTMRFAAADLARAEGVLAPSHAHNLALEPLAAWGLIGSAPTLAIFAVLAASLVGLRSTTDLVGFGTGVMLLSMLVHGAFEWPLLFPSLGVVFALVAALWLLSTRGEIQK